MIYCVSDIHGELDKLERMMELIRFSDADHLYIIGDVIDRGVMGVDILRWIMAAPNMTMLLGNHEQMCLDTLGPKNEFGARDLWRQNGGMPTYRELLYHRAPTERSSILRFLAGLPDHLELEVGRRKFHLVHGCPSEDRNARIWGRVTPDSRSPYPDTICIVGHTPTCFLTGKTDEEHRIWHGNNIIIDIDCGCGNLRSELRRLACLRLDDMAEFYVGNSAE
jgi:serine/threonine protein phosphatase 1